MAIPKFLKQLLQLLMSFVFYGYNTLATIGLTLLAYWFNKELMRVSGREGKGIFEAIGDILTDNGFIPWHVVIIALIALLLPTSTLVLTFFQKHLRTPRQLAKLFFGAEVPMMGLALLSTLFLRQVNVSTGLLLTAIGVSLVGLFASLFEFKKAHKPVEWFVLGAQHLALVVAGYAATLIAFFLPIIVAVVSEGLKQFQWSEVWRFFTYLFEYNSAIEIISILAGISLVFTTLAAFLVTPILATLTFWQVANLAAETLRKKFKVPSFIVRSVRVGVSAAMVLLLVIATWSGRAQRHTSDLEKLGQATTFADQQKLAKTMLRQDRAIKQNLLDMYLSPYRFISDSSMTFLQMAYEDVVKADENTAQTAQTWFNTLGAPFVYQGDFGEDVDVASKLYKATFDQSIQEGEKDAIKAALKATNVRDAFKADLLDEGEETVKLVSQVVTVNTMAQGAVAQVVIEEEYENTNLTEEEVYYEFSLPDDAVLTGLALGPDLQFGSLAAAQAMPDSPTPSQAPAQAAPTNASPEKFGENQVIDQGVVAPKGAAQQTFDNQVRRRLDPALVEQTGPRQYKLRVFPIPSTLQAERQENFKNQKVRYSYVVTQHNGGYELPKVTQVRNLFETVQTDHRVIVDGQTEVQSTNQTMVMAPRVQSCADQVISADIQGQTVMFVPYAYVNSVAQYYSCEQKLKFPSAMYQNLRIAVLFDASYSSQGTDWNEVLQDDALLAGALPLGQVDAYFFNTLLSEPMPLKSADQALEVINLGGTDRLAALQAVNGKGYDLVIMYTDAGETDNPHLTVQQVPMFDYEVFVAHLDGQVPSYQETFTKALVANNAEVVESGSQALNLYLARQAVAAQNLSDRVLDVGEEGIWVSGSSLLAAASLPAPALTDAQFALLAQRKFIMAEIAASNITHDLTLLDQLDAQARASGIVTPYSSLIALVNEDQRRQLRDAMASDRRYTVNYNDGEEALRDPSGQDLLSTSGVPEPHEWLLMGAAFTLAVYLYRQRLFEVLNRYSR